MKFDITKEQLLNIEKFGGADVSLYLKEHFAEAFKTGLVVGKWYVINNDPTYLLNYHGESEIDIHYGFMGNWDLWFFDEYHKNMCREATPEEVESALINEAKKRGFKKGYKSFPHNIYAYKITDSDFYFDSNNNQLFVRQKNDTFAKIFDNGKWAEILPQEKTVVPMEKALKIIAKKMKTTPENIEIQV